MITNLCVDLRFKLYYIRVHLDIHIELLLVEARALRAGEGQGCGQLLRGRGGVLAQGAGHHQAQEARGDSGQSHGRCLCSQQGSPPPHGVTRVTCHDDGHVRPPRRYGRIFARLTAVIGS